MKKKWKQTAAGVLLTLLIYLTIPMISAFLAVNEWADTENLLMPVLMAAVVSGAAGGLFLVRKGKWSVFAAALLAGALVPLLAMLVGYLVFGSAGMDGRRWMLPVAGFMSAIVTGLFWGQRKGRRKDSRTGKRKTH